MTVFPQTSEPGVLTERGGRTEAVARNQQTFSLGDRSRAEYHGPDGWEREKAGYENGGAESALPGTTVEGRARTSAVDTPRP